MRLVIEVGDGAGDFENAVVLSAGDIHLGVGLSEEFYGFVGEFAMFFYVLIVHFAVGGTRTVGESCCLNGSCLFDSLPDGCRCFGSGVGC